MLQKTRGIILHTLKHGESAIIAHIFTENYGRLSFLSYRSKKKNKIQSYLFHPLSLIELELDYKENRNIQKILEVQQTHLFTHLYTDIRRSTIAFFLGEILYKNIHESEPNKNFFEFIYNSILLLDMAGKGIENFHLVFLIQLSKFLGFFPGESFITRFNLEKQDNLSDIINISLTEIGSLNISNLQRQALLDNILELYNQNVIGTGQIKSLKVLREVLN